jgi:hypothetical protein
VLFNAHSETEDTMSATVSSKPVHSAEFVAQTTTRPLVRELDFRTSDGIDVRLLWNPSSNRVSVAVDDRRLGESLVFDVEPANALHAFHHPYAYAPTHT